VRATISAWWIDGWSALYCAVEGNNVEMMELLLEAGANPMDIKTTPVGTSFRCREVLQVS